MDMKPTPTFERGFTLLEVIATLIIIAIMAAVIVPRVGTTTDTYGLRAEADTLKAHLRYAQFRAMSDDVPWRMGVAAGSYTLRRSDGDGHWVDSNLPDGAGTPTHAFADGVAKTGAAQVVTFDQWGSPGGANITITLQAGDLQDDIVVTQNTGFIQ